MIKAVQRIADLFYPPRCVICDEVIASNERPFCRACATQTLPRIGTACRKCGRGKKACTCKNDTFLTDGIAAPFYYVDGISDAIAYFKRVCDRDRTRFFLEELIETVYAAFGEKVVDYITTVPLHANDLAERGFDQTEPLAKALSKELHVPYIRPLRKIFKTESQKHLSAERRTGNLLGAFSVRTKYPLKGKTVLLIDDVVTTGSTTNECAKMLKIYGVKQVFVLAIAVSGDEKDEEEDLLADLKERLAGKADNFT